MPASNSSGSQGAVGAFGGGKVGVSPTVSSAMPTTGSATYTGGAAGIVVANSATNGWYGTSSLTASFTSNSITGTISNIQAYSLSGGANTSLGTINNINLSGTISGATYSGTATAASGSGTYATIPTGVSFPMKGAFYGPSAQETAGNFGIVTNSTSGPNIIGGFGAKQPSDLRLKTDIEVAGVLPNGLRLYSWRYLGGRRRFTGVMAQDLLADARFAGAVLADADGVMRVDYDAIGYLPENLESMASEGAAAIAIFRASRAMLH